MLCDQRIIHWKIPVTEKHDPVGQYKHFYYSDAFKAKRSWNNRNDEKQKNLEGDCRLRLICQSDFFNFFLFWVCLKMFFKFWFISLSTIEIYLDYVMINQICKSFEFDKNGALMLHNAYNVIIYSSLCSLFNDLQN